MADTRVRQFEWYHLGSWKINLKFFKNLFENLTWIESLLSRRDILWYPWWGREHVGCLAGWADSRVLLSGLSPTNSYKKGPKVSNYVRTSAVGLCEIIICCLRFSNFKIHRFTPNPKFGKFKNAEKKTCWKYSLTKRSRGTENEIRNLSGMEYG